MRAIRPTVLAALLAAVAIPFAVLPGQQAARATAPTDQLPNLVADPPSGPYLNVYDYGNGTHDLLLRFDGYIHNAGAGALDVEGSRATTSDVMTPLQRIFDSSGGHRDDPMPGAQLIYSNGDGHHHWHLQNVARYSLWNGAKTQEVAPAMKVGFCLDDSQRIETNGPTSGVYTDRNGRAFCKQNQPDALSLFEGVSAGWRDIYDSGLAYQWVVASDVQPGAYWLREDVDLDNIVHESDETNPPAYATSATTIPGYLARAIAAPVGAYGAPQQVTLGADRFGSPGAERFKVVTPPAHGSLDVAPGSAFTGPEVGYTPAPGYSGPDSFTYVAMDSASEFPLHPAAATVALSVASPSPAVAIDGAPSSIETSHGVQLQATVTNDAGGVVWSVDGVDGGNAAAGTITSAGFYTAPAAVPASGSVTISARSLSGAHDERTVAITETPVPLPAPVPPPSSSQAPAETSSQLGPIAVLLSGHVLVARVTPRRAGAVSVTGTIGTRRLGRCHSRLAPRERFSCRMFLPPHMRLGRLTVVAQLTSSGKLLARRIRHGKPQTVRH